MSAACRSRPLALPLIAISGHLPRTRSPRAACRRSSAPSRSATRRRATTVASSWSLLRPRKRSSLSPEFSASVPAGRCGGASDRSAFPEIGRPRSCRATGSAASVASGPSVGMRPWLAKSKPRLPRHAAANAPGSKFSPARITSHASCGCRSTLPVAASRPAFCEMSNCSSSTRCGVPCTSSAMSAMRSGGPSDERASRGVELRAALEIRARRACAVPGRPRRRHDDLVATARAPSLARLRPRTDVAADVNQPPAARLMRRSWRSAVASPLRVKRSGSISSGSSLIVNLPGDRALLHRAVAAQRSGEALKLESGSNSSRGSKRGASSREAPGPLALRDLRLELAFKGAVSLLPMMASASLPCALEVPANSCSPAVQRNCRGLRRCKRRAGRRGRRTDHSPAASARPSSSRPGPRRSSDR